MTYSFMVCPIIVDPKEPTERLVLEIEDGDVSISEAVLTSATSRAVVANRRSTVSLTTEELEWLADRLAERRAGEQPKVRVNFRKRPM